MNCYICNSKIDSRYHWIIKLEYFTPKNVQFKLCAKCATNVVHFITTTKGERYGKESNEKEKN